MVTIIHIVVSLVNAILKIVAVSFLKGASLLLTVALIVLSLSAALGASGLGAFKLLRRKRNQSGPL